MADTQRYYFPNLEDETNHGGNPVAAAMFFHDSDGNWRRVGYTWSLPTISHARLKTNQGRVFVASHIFTTVGNNASADILIQTNGQTVHIDSPYITVTGLSRVFLYEGTTFSDAGTAMAEVNKNRTSDRTATAVFTRGPTVSELGTLLNTYEIPAGSGGTAAGAGDQGSINTEWILASGTAYLYRITNVSGQARDISVRMEWYEAGVQE